MFPSWQSAGLGVVVSVVCFVEVLVVLAVEVGVGVVGVLFIFVVGVGVVIAGLAVVGVVVVDVVIAVLVVDVVVARFGSCWCGCFFSHSCWFCSCLRCS